MSYDNYASLGQRGVPARAIEAVLKRINSDGKDIHSFMLMRGGEVLWTNGFAPHTIDTVHNLFSVSKSFTSVLVGIAQKKGILSIDETFASIFPDKLPDNPDENLLNMTLRDALKMATGHAVEPFSVLFEEPNGDWVKGFLSAPVELTPGSRFLYNTPATYMLSATLTKKTGKTALELANQWLFPKIGIKNAVWDTCPKGISCGGFGLHLTTPDLAKFGQLLLQKGIWNDDEVIPPEYLAEANAFEVQNYGDTPNWASGYGYQFWMNAFGGFRADGMGGQFIVVKPDLDMVVVFTSALGSDIGYPLTLIEEEILPRLSGTAVDNTQEELSALCALKHACEHPSVAPKNADWDHVAIEWGENPFNWKVMRFDAQGEVMAIDLDGQSVLAGWGVPIITHDFRVDKFNRVGDAAFRVMADNDALKLTAWLIGEPLTYNFRFKREANNIAIDLKVSMETDDIKPCELVAKVFR